MCVSIIKQRETRQLRKKKEPKHQLVEQQLDEFQARRLVNFRLGVLNAAEQRKRERERERETEREREREQRLAAHVPHRLTQIAANAAV